MTEQDREKLYVMTYIGIEIIQLLELQKKYYSDVDQLIKETKISEKALQVSARE